MSEESYHASDDYGSEDEDTYEEVINALVDVAYNRKCYITDEDLRSKRFYKRVKQLVNDYFIEEEESEMITSSE